MTDQPNLIDQIAQELHEQQGVELVPGRHLAADILALVVGRAAAAFSRSGTEFGVDPDGPPLGELLAELLDEIAGKAAGTLLQWDDAMRMSRDDQLPFPNAAVSDLLAVVAALRAAIGYQPTPTAREIIAARRDTDKVTQDGDAVRLHLAAHHGLLFTFGASDRLARNEHARRHAAGDHGHHHEDLSWNSTHIEAEIAEAVTEGYPEGQFQRPFREHLARHWAHVTGGDR